MRRYEFSKFELKINKKETDLISQWIGKPGRLLLATESQSKNREAFVIANLRRESGRGLALPKSAIP